nr:hypothetical protein [Streptomyces roseus]
MSEVTLPAFSSKGQRARSPFSRGVTGSPNWTAGRAEFHSRTSHSTPRSPRPMISSAVFDWAPGPPYTWLPAATPPR